ncbi:MAG: hypothetical protein ACE5HS_14585, partial [bacterium]
TGKLWFYNNRGRLTQEVTLFPQAEYDLERSQHLALSADGSALTVAASNRSSVPGSENAATVQEAQVFLFRANGERLWRSILPENRTALTALSTDGKFTAVGCYNSDDPANIKKRTLLFDGAGQRIGEAKILFIMAAFSPDSKYLILADNHAVEMLELASGQTLWTQNLNRQHGRLTAVALSNAADFAIALIAKSHFKANTFVFSEPRLRVYSRTGTMVQEISFAGEEFATSALTLSDDARALAIGFKNSYYLFEAHR